MNIISYYCQYFSSRILLNPTTSHVMWAGCWQSSTVRCVVLGTVIHVVNGLQDVKAPVFRITAPCMHLYLYLQLSLFQYIISLEICLCLRAKKKRISSVCFALSRNEKKYLQKLFFHPQNNGPRVFIQTSYSISTLYPHQIQSMVYLCTYMGVLCKKSVFLNCTVLIDIFCLCDFLCKYLGAIINIYNYCDHLEIFDCGLQSGA